MQVPRFEVSVRPDLKDQKSVPPFVRAALDARQEAHMWRLVALGTLGFALLIVFFTFKASRPAQLGLVLGEDGTLVSGPLVAISKNGEFFRRSSIYATQAALMRTEEGPDLSELVQLYYNNLGIQSLQSNIKEWKADFKRRKLSWKPSILSVSEPIDEGSSKMVEVKALLHVTGIFSNRPLYEEREVKLLLHWAPNTDLQTGANYPWKVTHTEFTISDAH